MDARRYGLIAWILAVVVAGCASTGGLAGSLGSFKTGDRVCVRGKIAGASICMAGDATLTIESIDAESACR